VLELHKLLERSMRTPSGDMEIFYNMKGVLVKTGI
jgi:hypothetical protein